MSRDMQRNDMVKGAGGGAPQQQQMMYGGGMMPQMQGMPQMPPQGQQPYGQMPLGASFNYNQTGQYGIFPPPNQGGFQNPYQKWRRS